MAERAFRSREAYSWKTAGRLRVLWAMARTIHPSIRPQPRDAVEPRLAPPSGIPRRLALAGTLLVFAGIASLLAALVPGVLVGFGDPAASAELTPPVSLAVALTLGGGVLTHIGWLFARADGRRR